jgi:hypothetical protein
MTAGRRALIVVAVFIAVAFGCLWGGAVPEAAAQISVASADPKTGEQGALNLSVTIAGKGFKNGAKAAFFKTRTTDPAGVNVKSTQFVSSTQLIALVDIADAAALSLFDIQVANTDGRTGKGTELFSVVAKGRTSLDVPLTVEFADYVGPESTPAGWYSDGGNYASDAGKRYVIAEVAYYELQDYDPVGGFRFEVAAPSGRTVLFDFSRLVVVNPRPAWCPEACPDQPTLGPPDFAADPIKLVTLFDSPQYSPPNYDFLTPAWCESVWADGLCPNDFRLSIQTSSREEYYLSFSPNLWRALALPNTARGGSVMAVAYDSAADTWRLSPLLSRTVNGVPLQEPCPVLVERKAVVKDLNTRVFLGCYDMPFEITLAKR